MIYEKPRTEDREYADLMIKVFSALVEYRLGRDELGNIVICDEGDEAENPLSIGDYIEEELTGNWSFLVSKSNFLESLLITLSYGDQKDDPKIEMDTGAGRIFFKRENSLSYVAIPCSLAEKLEDWAIDEISFGGILQ